MYKVQFFLLYTSMHMRRESKPHENLTSQRNERSFRLCTYIILMLSSMSYERYNALVTISLKPHSRICLSFCFGDWLEKCVRLTLTDNRGGFFSSTGFIFVIYSNGGPCLSQNSGLLANICTICFKDALIFCLSLWLPICMYCFHWRGHSEGEKD